MAKKQPKEIIPEKKGYLIPVKHLAETAHNIAALRPNETIILNRLIEIYEEAADDGFQYCISCLKHKREKRDARIKNSYDSFIKNIEDTIHGGVVTKKATSDNQ